MNKIRLAILVIATICALAIAAFALVMQAGLDPADDIIIKGGSLEIQCGQNQGNDCLGTPDANGKYKHKQGNAHIMQVTVKDDTGKVVYTGSFDKNHQPEIRLNYK